MTFAFVQLKPPLPPRSRATMAQSSQDEDFFASSPPNQSQGSHAGPSNLPAVDVEAALPPAEEGDGVDAPSLFRGGSVDDQDDDDELIETVRVKKRQKIAQSPVPKQNTAIDAIDLDENGQGSASPEPQWRRRYVSGHFRRAKDRFTDAGRFGS